jgi:hypothetical protein
MATFVETLDNRLSAKPTRRNRSKVPKTNRKTLSIRKVPTAFMLQILHSLYIKVLQAQPAISHAFLSSYFLSHEVK